MAKKNILMLVFSSRKNGNCDISGKIFSKKFNNSNFLFEEVDVTKLNLKPCTGCFGCNNGSFKCIIADDLDGIKNKIENANIIITIAPCFIFSVPARMRIIMERLAAWALNSIESGVEKKIGIGINFAGAPNEWHSSQRSQSSLFLTLFNCDIKYLKTFEKIGLKGEVLLYPDILGEIESVSDCLKLFLENEKTIFPSDIEDEQILLCPNCHGDSFRVLNRKKYICTTCGLELIPSAFLKKNKISGLNKLSPDGADEHTRYIGGKIANSFSVIEDIEKRLEYFEEKGSFDKTVYNIKREENAHSSVEWDADGLAEFKKVVPKGFQSFVKRAVEKKATEQGIALITKEVFLMFKKKAVG